MYFVDRRKIEQILTYADTILYTFPEQPANSLVQQLGLERAIHLLIESFLDVGNMMIDGFIMRDPGSYNDIIDILIDESVLPKEDELAYKELIQLRQCIVQDYVHIDHTILERTLSEHKMKLNQFSTHIRTYLDNEMGVAHTFSNNT
ncbi:DUF86 domain-containing protein [Virgibacillus sp. W0430]|uniref:DUF86 domain-containing protein n=1 Tax=Virgibacillus sp. W0430 TaxID=3391580 RepID=UPI003F445E8B